MQIDAHLLELCETHIDELFKRIDEDDDGEISLQETLLFVETAPGNRRHFCLYLANNCFTKFQSPLLMKTKMTR